MCSRPRRGGIGARVCGPLPAWPRRPRSPNMQPIAHCQLPNSALALAVGRGRRWRKIWHQKLAFGIDLAERSQK